MTPASAVASVRRVGGRAVLWVVVAIEVAFLVGPIIATMILSFSSSRILAFPVKSFSLKWYQAVLHDPQWVDSALVSLEISAIVMLAAAVVGAPAAYALVRGRLPGSQVFLGVLLTPLITPTILLAVGFAIILIDRGYAATPAGLVFAQTVIAVPYMTLNCAISLRSIPRDLELAAMSLGANRIRTFFRVTLPLMRRGLVAGAIFAFLAAWDDATAVLFITGPRLTTLPVYLLTTVQDDLNPEVAAVAGFLFMFAVLIAGAVMVMGGIQGVGGVRRRRAVAPVADEVTT